MSIFFDCPLCGLPSTVNRYEPAEVVSCGHCDVRIYMKQGLNRRSTPERIEGRGFFGRLFMGSTIQLSKREKLESLVKLGHTAMRFEMLGDDRQASILTQLQLNRLYQELDDIYRRMEGR